MEIKEDLAKFLSLQVELIEYFETSCRLIPQDNNDYFIEFEVVTSFFIEDLKKVVGEHSVVVFPSTTSKGSPCVLVRVVYRYLPFSYGTSTLNK